MGIKITKNNNNLPVSCFNLLIDVIKLKFVIFVKMIYHNPSLMWIYKTFKHPDMETNGRNLGCGYLFGLPMKDGGLFRKTIWGKKDGWCYYWHRNYTQV